MAEKGDTTTSTSVGELSTSGKEVPKAVIKNVDMSEEMQQEAVDVASAALEKYNIEKDIAAQIKKEFDKRHGPTWHVVVGKNFGSYVTHGECSLSLTTMGRRACFALCARVGRRADGGIDGAETKHFIYFYIGSLAILIWKS